MNDWYWYVFATIGLMIFWSYCLEVLIKNVITHYFEEKAKFEDRTKK